MRLLFSAIGFLSAVPGILGSADECGTGCGSAIEDGRVLVLVAALIVASRGVTPPLYGLSVICIFLNRSMAPGSFSSSYALASASLATVKRLFRRIGTAVVAIAGEACLAAAPPAFAVPVPPTFDTAPL